MREMVTVDFLIVANHAELVNGLLYLVGGGWTDHHRAVRVGADAPMSHLGIAVGVRVPWNETNQPHLLTIQIEDEDASSLLKLEATLKVGRPPQLTPGTEQPVVFGFPIDVRFPSAGGYRVVARLDSEGEVKRWGFRVHDIPVGA